MKVIKITTADLIARKINSIKMIEEMIDDILELGKEDVMKILRSNGKPISYNFFELYKEASEYTKRSIRRKTRSFKKIAEQKDIKKTINWIISRQANNVVNIATDARYRAHTKADFVEFADWNIYFEEKNIEKEIEIEKIRNFPKEKKIKAIKKVWRECLFENTYDSDILEYFCDLIGIEKEEVFPNQEKIDIKIEKTKNGNKQLFFVI